eukprot:scaffold772_cov339-Pavlova_lutheri.AAC.49
MLQVVHVAIVGDVCGAESGKLPSDGRIAFHFFHSSSYVDVQLLRTSNGHRRTVTMHPFTTEESFLRSCSARRRSMVFLRARRARYPPCRVALHSHGSSACPILVSVFLQPRFSRSSRVTRPFSWTCVRHARVVVFFPSTRGREGEDQGHTPSTRRALEWDGQGEWTRATTHAAWERRAWRGCREDEKEDVADGHRLEHVLEGTAASRGVHRPAESVAQPILPRTARRKPARDGADDSLGSFLQVRLQL